MLVITYRIEADPSDIVLPKGLGLRRDGLWKSTCFELFLGKSEYSNYREYNFSPGGDWAGYEFLSYRHGQRNLLAQSEPSIELKASDHSVSLIAILSVDAMSDGDPFSLTAVIDERDFGLSYWSTWHDRDMPDFHRASCFRETLPPPSEA